MFPFVHFWITHFQNEKSHFIENVLGTLVVESVGRQGDQFGDSCGSLTGDRDLNSESGDRFGQLWVDFVPLVIMWEAKERRKPGR